MEVCSDTAADDDDALALRIEMVDVEDDDAAAALQIAANVMMSIRDCFIVFILLSGGRVYKLSVYSSWNHRRCLVLPSTYETPIKKILVQ